MAPRTTLATPAARAADTSFSASEAREQLYALLNDHVRFLNEGFSIDLYKDTPVWHRCFQALGPKKAYDFMSRYLCARYRELYGRELLFSERCVTHEIAYHTDAYMWAMGYRGYHRDPTTLLFTRDTLDRHCRSVDISDQDVYNPKQMLAFRYRRGIRPALRGTERDPYDRRPFRYKPGETLPDPATTATALALAALGAAAMLAALAGRRNDSSGGAL